MSSDFYQIATYDRLAPEDYRTLFKVREFMNEKVAPIINKHWLADIFPYELLPEFKTLDIIDKSPLLTGLIVMEMGRIDPSIATFYNIQNGLVIGSINHLGTEEQNLKYIRPLANFEKIGCFALTEPDVGSGILDMKTTCRRDGDMWAINGQKKWVGNATWANIAIVWARDTSRDNDIKGFIIDIDKCERSEFVVEKIKDKFGLKVCQNGLIDIHAMVPEENRLQGNFKDILQYTRYLVACEATGCQIGAYEHTLKYAKERKQFGKPIASFQLIQDLLAKILANVTACQCMVYQLAKSDMTYAQTALAKAFTTIRLRETVGWAREIFGANGMSIEYNIGRFFTDAEAIYTYEGSYQMNNLIVGKAITGLSAFV